MSSRPRLYFSFRSPYSWMAIHRLARSVPRYDDEVDMVPYWDPDPDMARAVEARGATLHYASMTKAKHLYILQDTKRSAARLGLDMRWPVDVDPWWEVPHLAWLAARAAGAARPFYDAVVAARWERGARICDIEVIAEAARAVGLDPHRLATAASDSAVRDEAAGALVAAWEDDVFGVPYLRFGFERYWGLDRVDAMVDALGRRRPGATTDPLADMPAALTAAVGALDTDTAGGCG